MNTDFGSLTTLQKRMWSALVNLQGRDDNFFESNGFVSSSTQDTGKVIQRVTELTKTERGTECVMPLVADLTSGGVVGDNDLDGNEVSLVADSLTIRIDQLRNGVKSAGRMSEQQTVLRFRVQAKDALAFWLADTKDDLTFMTAAGRAYSLNTDGSVRTGTQIPQLRFGADVTAPTGNRIMHAGTATSEASLTAADTMTWNLVIAAKSFAKRKRVRPIRAGGRGYYILVLSTEQSRDLSSSSDYKTLQAQAMPRGMDNPLFTNAKRVIEDVVLYDHQKLFNTLGMTSGSKWGAGGTIDGAQAMLMGAQAIGMAQLSDGSPGFEESDKTDYGNRQGLGIGRIFGLRKSVYKSRYDNQSSEDYGIVHLKTAARA